jgi:RNA polymerase sigma-70 factor (ECF subfamily)
MLNSKKRRQEKAFTQMYNENHDFLYSVALNLTCRDQELAYDILQESMTKAYKAFHNFDGKSPRAWLKTIVRNTYFDHYKKHKKELKSRVQGEFEDIIRTQAAAPEKEFTVEDFEALLLALEENPESDDWIQPLSTVVNDELLNALKEIPSKYRAALLLQHVTQLSYEEIADTMQCKMGTVMSRLSRARDALKEVLIQQNNLIGQKLRALDKNKQKSLDKTSNLVPIQQSMDSQSSLQTLFQSDEAIKQKEAG